MDILHGARVVQTVECWIVYAITSDPAHLMILGITSVSIARTVKLIRVFPGSVLDRHLIAYVCLLGNTGIAGQEAGNLDKFIA
jgi:hypothetical protein